MVIAITGATGLLGSNILFELLKIYESSNTPLLIWVLGRPAEGYTLLDRIRQLLEVDGRYYLGTSDPLRFLANIRTIDCFLDQPGLGISEGQLRQIREYPPDLFIHSAAEVDFRDQPAVLERLNEINVKGTERIIAFAASLGCPDFALVSTAYVCGIRSGTVEPDYIPAEQAFRNPYERSKLLSEQFVRQAQTEERLGRVHIFRPTTICGRLIEPPTGYTRKFDVFYAWLSFFLRLKSRQLGGIDYQTPTEIDIRVALKPGSGLNIIPADFAAKALVNICLQQPESNSYHLASPYLTDNYEDLPALLDFIKVSLPEFVEKMPATLTPLERLYYHKSVGKIYDPYISQPVPHFSLETLQQQLPADFAKCPAVKGPELLKLLEFAKQHDFGL